MPDNNEVKRYQEIFLSRAKARRDPLNVSISGLEIVVNPHVFPPATDTKLLISKVNTQPGDRMIDVTTGSGVTAIVAGFQGASGYAVDINPHAVMNARENIERYGLDIAVLESDLFSNVPEEKFDYIFANGPFFEGEIAEPMDYACYGARMFIEKLLEQSNGRLKPEGRLLLVMSVWSDLDHVEKVAAANNLRASVIGRRNSDDGEREYLLYEISQIVLGQGA